MQQDEGGRSKIDNLENLKRGAKESLTSTSEGWNKTAAAGLGGAAARMELPAKPRRVVQTTPAGTKQTARLHARCGEIILKTRCQI